MVDTENPSMDDLNALPYLDAWSAKHSVHMPLSPSVAGCHAGRRNSSGDSPTRIAKENARHAYVSLLVLIRAVLSKNLITGKDLRGTNYRAAHFFCEPRPEHLGSRCTRIHPGALGTQPT
ncbi:hypothetical protein MVEN_01856700 [Mycena venus]|uniref:Uncharacterized protein n=1 Tax=Mycena venus TaxID=2733690 RepID=A0A8H6XHD9_9AGAR|nr:hypothetical protein MVEN_01856700 [Mycena venus]